MSREDSAAGTVVVAFVLGAITGAAVALLVAPASGEETRRMLAERAREAIIKVIPETAGKMSQATRQALRDRLYGSNWCSSRFIQGYTYAQAWSFLTTNVELHHPV